MISCKEIKNQIWWNIFPGLVLSQKKFAVQIIGTSLHIRDEKTASFKINRNKNCRFDFGIGKGGNIIHFAILYHDCTVGEFLKMFQDHFYFHRQTILITPMEDEEDEGRIRIL